MKALRPLWKTEHSLIGPLAIDGYQLIIYIDIHRKTAPIRFTEKRLGGKLFTFLLYQNTDANHR